MKMLGLGFHHYPNIYYRTSLFVILTRLADVASLFFCKTPIFFVYFKLFYKIKMQLYIEKYQGTGYYVNVCKLTKYII